MHKTLNQTILDILAGGLSAVIKTQGLVINLDVKSEKNEDNHEKISTSIPVEEKVLENPIALNAPVQLPDLEISAPPIPTILCTSGNYRIFDSLDKDNATCIVKNYEPSIDLLDLPKGVISTRLRCQGDPIRGDLKIIPCSSVYPRESDLQQGAMNILTGNSGCDKAYNNSGLEPTKDMKTTSTLSDLFEETILKLEETKETKEYIKPIEGFIEAQDQNNLIVIKIGKTQVNIQRNNFVEWCNSNNKLICALADRLLCNSIPIRGRNYAENGWIRETILTASRMDKEEQEKMVTLERLLKDEIVKTETADAKNIEDEIVEREKELIPRDLLSSPVPRFEKSLKLEPVNIGILEEEIKERNNIENNIEKRDLVDLFTTFEIPKNPINIQAALAKELKNRDNDQCFMRRSIMIDDITKQIVQDREITPIFEIGEELSETSDTSLVDLGLDEKLKKD